jgi:hypothetical protein
MRRRLAIALLLLGAAVDATAALTPGTSVPVRILYDNSGSMYAGYQPPGANGRQTRAALGARFLHQSPAFASWLGDFVKRQTIVDGGTAGMWTLTSFDRFTPGDIREVHPAVPLDAFDAGAAIRNFPAKTGASTYLTEAIQHFTRDFTGLVWLVTDNIVETNGGAPDEGVRRFFETLRSQPEIRSVHLFKYPINEGEQAGVLAVYALLVSPTDVPVPTLADYDGKFRTLGDAKRPGGADLFPGRGHLKLKDLSVEPLIPDLRLVPEFGEDGVFKEGNTVRLSVQGEIKSFLTQHSVTGGRYDLSIATPFVAEEQAQRDFGAQPLLPQVFNTASGEIRKEIPPGGTQDVKVDLQSTQPFTFTPRGLGAWLRLAWNGATVRYTANARMAFADVKVRLERERMAGIFGIDQASGVFAFQDVTTLPHIKPTDVPVSFTLRTGSSRTAIFLIALAILLALIAAAAFLLSRTQIFRIAISGTPERITALRRLGRHDVTLEGKLLGRLWRGPVNGYSFDPIRGDAALTVVPASDPDTWEIRFTGTSTRHLSIKADGASPAKPRKPRGTSPARAAPPAPPPIPSSRGIPPPPPRIGRP